MLKEIIIKCASFISRDDIVKLVSEENFNPDDCTESAAGDIKLLISCFNIACDALMQKISAPVFCEKIMTDRSGKIPYTHFSRTPSSVISVTTPGGKKVKFGAAALFIQTDISGGLVIVRYRYVPMPRKSLDDSTDFLPENMINAVCYAAIAEFLDAKSKFSESKVWKDKFFTELFNLSKGERRIKSSYCV